jgi:hypothetical protein
MGAPLGNKNAAKAKVWHAAIMRALERRTAKREDGQLEIDALSDNLIQHIDAGDLSALKEFGDRMDGKPAQAIIGGGDDDPPIKVARIELVDL